VNSPASLPGGKNAGHTGGNTSFVSSETATIFKGVEVDRERREEITCLGSKAVPKQIYNEIWDCGCDHPNRMVGSGYMKDSSW
jgi:hypothetical protein